MPTATLDRATCKVIGRPKPGKNGNSDYRPVLFTLASGEEFWKSYPIDADELTWLTKGQTYAVAIANNDHTIIRPEGTPDSSPEVRPTAPTSSPAPMPPTAQATGGIPDGTKKAIAPYAKDLIALYAFCYQQAVESMPGSEQPTITAATDAVFNAVREKFLK